MTFQSRWLVQCIIVSALLNTNESCDPLPGVPRDPFAKSPRSTMLTNGINVDRSWKLQIYVTDFKIERRLRVMGDLHVEGVLLKLVETLGESIFSGCKMLARPGKRECLWDALEFIPSVTGAFKMVWYVNLFDPDILFDANYISEYINPSCRALRADRWSPFPKFPGLL